jgi:hypothetical protein
MTAKIQHNYFYVIIFLILNLKKNYSKWNKYKILIKINPTHLIEVEHQI